jgi:hypothetical protein
MQGGERSHRKPSYFRHAAGAASAGDVEQVALGVVDFLQIGVVADRRYALLLGDYFVVAGHHDHGPKLQTLGEAHGTYRDLPVGGFDVFIENLESNTRFLEGSAHTMRRGLACRGPGGRWPVRRGGRRGRSLRIGFDEGENGRVATAI